MLRVHIQRRLTTREGSMSNGNAQKKWKQLPQDVGKESQKENTNCMEVDGIEEKNYKIYPRKGRD